MDFGKCLLWLFGELLGSWKESNWRIFEEKALSFLEFNSTF